MSTKITSESNKPNIYKHDRPKVGLALGSGTARGLAHIGVVKVFEKEGIKIDYLAGSSMGAIVAGIYASGKSADEMEKMALEFRFGKVAQVARLSFSRSGLFKSKSIEKVLRKLIGDITFEDLKIPLKVICTDICTGEEVIFDKGLLRKALSISASFPGFFVPQEYNNRYLVDGGLVNPIPANIVSKMGSDVVIAVSVNRDVRKYTEFMKRKKYSSSFDKFNKVSESYNYESLFWENASGKSGLLDLLSFKKNHNWKPNIFHILMQSIYIAEEKIALAQLNDTHIDLLMSPDLGHITMFDFNKAVEIIKCGETAAYESLPKIKSILKKI